MADVPSAEPVRRLREYAGWTHYSVLRALLLAAAERIESHETPAAPEPAFLMLCDDYAAVMSEAMQ